MKKKLMAPGPVPISPKVLQVFSEPIIHHRTPEFEQILSEVLDGLKEVFQTKQPVCILPGTGTAAMEAAIVNTLSTGDKVLCLVSGKFGQRWAEICNTYGLDTDILPCKWGSSFPIEDLQASLSAKKYKAVFCQGVETSTGTIHPISEIGKLIKQINKSSLFIVDAITSLGVSNISMATDSIDVLIAGSQKAFMLPTGMSFICLSKLAWKASKTANTPKYYLDIMPELKSNENSQTRFSSLVSHIRALHFVLKEFSGVKLQHRIHYSKDSSTAFRQCLRELGLAIFSKHPAPSLTAITVPEDVDGAKLRKDIESQFNVTIMGGQDHLKGKILRIGHMGHIQKQDYITTLRALQKALALQNYIIDDDIFASAIQNFKQNMVKDYSDYFNY